MGKWFTPENEARLKRAATESTCMAEMCRLLGVTQSGSTYDVLRRHIGRLEIDTSHHKTYHGKGGKRKDPSLLVSKAAVRLMLIRTHGHRCWTCGLTEWMGKPAPLEIDHINGDPRDHSRDNVRVLCCNCHAQTANYRGANSDATSWRRKVASHDSNMKA